MPRRNRNAHTPAPDTDRLAGQTRQLLAELTTPTLTNDLANGVLGRSITIYGPLNGPLATADGKAVTLGAP